VKFHQRDRSGTRGYRYLMDAVEPTGTVRLYFRRKGQPKIRLYETLGTPEWGRPQQLSRER